MASPKIISLTEENFTKEVLEFQGAPVLVDFWAEWCGPCKMLGPVLDELAEEYDGRVRIGKVDIDQFQMLAAKYNITAVPTLLLFKQGEVVEQMRGFRSKRELKASFDRAAAAA